MEKKDSSAMMPAYTPKWLDVSLQSVGDGIIAVDRRGFVKFLNGRACEMTGWEASGAVGRPLSEVFVAAAERDPDAGPQADAILAQANADDAEQTAAYLLADTNGERRLVRCVTAPTRSARGRRTGAVLCFQDISAERRSKRTQSLLAAIVADSDDAIISLTLDGDILSWNAAAKRLFGYSAEEAIGQSINLIIPDEWRLPARAILERLRRGERVDHFEAQRVAKDGRRIDVSLTISPLHDATGNVIGFSKVARDVTEKHATAAALTASEEQRRVIFHQAAVGMAMADLDGNFLEVNKRLASMLGYSVDELAELSVQQVTHPDDRDITRDYMEAIARGDVSYRTVEKRFHRKDGGEVWTLTTVSLLKGGHGQPRRFLGIVEDLTSRKIAEQQLRESEERFRLLADNILQLAWMADAKGWIFWYNQRWYDYTGTTLEEMQGWGWKDVHHPDHVERVVERIKYSWDTGELWEDTFPLRGKDGQYRWFLSRALPVRDDAGRIIRWFGTHTDITDQRNAEEALKAASRRKDEFLAMLAHELRNPLAPIRTGLDLLALEGHPHAEAIGMMQQQVQHLVRLVDDLLDVSRIMRGKIELRSSPVDLCALARRAIASVSPAAQAGQLSVTVDMPEQPLWVHADDTRMMQVLDNLLGNAIKYTDAGGTVRVSVGQEGDLAVATIVDTGVGLEPELLPHVFELFTQASRSLDRSQGGLGIGLTLVRQIVQMHGGSVEARSDGAGRGSTFTVTLPLCPTPTDETSDESPSTLGRPQRILVVDDNATAAKILQLLLSKLGEHDIHVAADGLEALDKARQIRPEIVFLDIGLPSMDGYEVARLMRAEQHLKEVRIVALTGYGQESDRERSAEAGIDVHLVKPAGLEELEAVLQS